MATRTSKGGTQGSTRLKQGSAKTAHKAYQSIQPCGNKLLQQRWDQKYYDEHRRLVKTAKPMVDTSAPTQRPHVASKLKKQQLAKERKDVIDRDNHTLLKKMQHIMNTEGGVEHKSTYKHHSLNQLQRQREMERVAEENKKMLKRIQTVEPMYKVSDWIDDWRRKEELTGMITAYPDELDTPTCKTTPSNSKPQTPSRKSKTTPAVASSNDTPTHEAKTEERKEEEDKMDESSQPEGNSEDKTLPEQ